jgi:hypothetical protein
MAIMIDAQYRVEIRQAGAFWQWSLYDYTGHPRRWVDSGTGHKEAVDAMASAQEHVARIREAQRQGEEE